MLFYCLPAFASKVIRSWRLGTLRAWHIWTLLAESSSIFFERLPENKASAQRTDNLIIGKSKENNPMMQASIRSSSCQSNRTPFNKLKDWGCISSGERISASAVHSPTAGSIEKIGSMDALPKRKHETTIKNKIMRRITYCVRHLAFLLFYPLSSCLFPLSLLLDDFFCCSTCSPIFSIFSPTLFPSSFTLSLVSFAQRLTVASIISVGSSR